MIFNCPTCSTPLGELESAGAQTFLCSKCRFKYRAESGVVQNRSSRQITHQRQSTRQTGVYDREYGFRLAGHESPVQLLTVRIPGKEDRLPTKKGDTVSVIHVMRGQQQEELVALVNQSTGQLLPVDEPGRRSTASSGNWGCLMLVVAMVILVPVGVPLWLSVLISAALAFIATRYAHEQLLPRHEVSSTQKAALADRTSLLERKHHLSDHVARVRDDLRDKQGLRDRLLSLRDKMEHVGEVLYVSRIRAIDRAIPMIDEQLTLDTKLLKVYQRSILMVDIELETRAGTESIPEDITLEFEARGAELMALEERNREIESLLAANEEVEQLLRGG
jgi:hypothetical protein